MPYKIIGRVGGGGGMACQLSCCDIDRDKETDLERDRDREKQRGRDRDGRRERWKEREGDWGGKRVVLKGS